MTVYKSEYWTIKYWNNIMKTKVRRRSFSTFSCRKALDFMFKPKILFKKLKKK